MAVNPLIVRRIPSSPPKARLTTTQTDAQRAMASALLWHFEDDDVRTENGKLRAELINSQEERARLEDDKRELVENVAAACREQEKAQLETTAWRNYIIRLNGMMTSLLGEDKPPPNEKLDDTIIRRIRNCCVTLKQVSTAYKNVATENAALQARIAQLEQLPPASTAHPPSPSSLQDPCHPVPQVDDIVMENAGSDSVPVRPPPAVDVHVPSVHSRPDSSSEVDPASAPKPGSPSTPAQAAAAGSSTSQRSASHPQPAPTTPTPAHCHCPSTVVLSAAQTATLNRLPEPTRARDWMQAVFDTPSVSQKEVYNAYQELGPAAEALHPAHLFALFKTVFPAAATVCTVGPGGEPAYIMCGITRKRAPCVCGRRES